MHRSTCDLCDDFPDEVAVAEPLFRDYGARERFSGRIVTIRCHEDNSRVREAVAENGAGRVLVVDGGGSLRRSLLGDQLAATAAANGWAGMLIHGAVRDVEVLAGTDLGIKALAAIPRRTDRKGAGERDVALRFAGVDFVPGEFLFADGNGVVVAARDLLADG